MSLPRYINPKPPCPITLPSVQLFLHKSRSVSPAGNFSANLWPLLTFGFLAKMKNKVLVHERYNSLAKQLLCTQHVSLFMKHLSNSGLTLLLAIVAICY